MKGRVGRTLNGIRFSREAFPWMRNLVDLYSNPLIPNGCRCCRVMDRRDGAGAWTMERQHAGDRATTEIHRNAFALPCRCLVVVARPGADARLILTIRLPFDAN